MELLSTNFNNKVSITTQAYESGWLYLFETWKAECRMHRAVVNYALWE